ncbi:MAG: phosphoribosylaminoimidazolesuccinocarboxamide synthase [Candidatus Baltobacteraceae bacterium]
MNKGLEVARGKTKILYEKPGQPDVLVVRALDAITAGDGARRNEIAGKGRIAAKTTARIFRLLNLCGLPTHYRAGGEDDDDNEMLVSRCTMIPLEVVVRGVAAGSLVRRRPEIARGSILVPRIVEFFLKDDANHDPLIEPDEIVRRGIASPHEIGLMSEVARITFEILSHAWRRRDTLLVDMKVEFGRLVSGEGRGSVVLADVIDNDSWRIWPQGREDLMLDKQLYRNLATVTQADLDVIQRNYEQVAELVNTFLSPRQGMVALVADGPQSVPLLDPLLRELGRFPVQTLRRVVSSHVLPNYVIQLLQQLDATFPWLVYVASGPQLAAMIAAATTSPVYDATELEPDELALALAKTFALEDTIMFGRVMLTQAAARSAILQADAQLNAPAAPPNGTLA